MIDLDTQKSRAPDTQHWSDESPTTPDRHNVFEGIQGKGVMMAGVFLPSIFFAIFSVTCFERICMLLIKHPVETVVECLLALSIPYGNYAVWTALCKEDYRFAIRRGIQNGLAIGNSLVCMLVAIAAVSLGRTVEGFAALAVVFLLSLSTAIHLAIKLRSVREVRSARLRTLIYSGIGVVLSLLSFAGSEAKSMVMRAAEHMAIAGTHQERQNGLNLLRAINPEKDMRLECADPRTAGLAGLFIPVSNRSQQQLYFAVTGKPFHDEKTTDLSAYSDDYLHKHVVGPAVPGLSLLRSAMTGVVNPNTLSSTVSWDFVFKNTNYEDKEARAEIGLPPGAVISALSVWKDGQPLNASFGPSGRALMPGNWWATLGHDDPAVVTDLGKGRSLLHCYPVAAQEELKVRISAVMPLKLDKETEASFVLPRFIDTNFAIDDDDKMNHQLRLRSPEILTLAVDGVKSAQSPTGEYLLSGSLTKENLSSCGLSVTSSRASSFAPIAIYDPLSSKYVAQTIMSQPASLPTHLVVVLDGSQSVKQYLPDVATALSSLPKKVPTSLIIATETQSELREPLPMAAGLKKLARVDFRGGQDNLQAVVKAAGIAGETTHGAVLWIHGPQPTQNKEIYIMTPYVKAPAFYELTLANGGTDGNDFFKNHREIGPFMPLGRNGNVKEDLSRFASKWQPDGKEFIVHTAYFNRLPGNLKSRSASAQEGAELATLKSYQNCQNLIAAGKYDQAANVAVSHHFVSPVSIAVVPEGKLVTNSSDMVAKTPGWADGDDQSNRPSFASNTTEAAALPQDSKMHVKANASLYQSQVSSQPTSASEARSSGNVFSDSRPVETAAEEQNSAAPACQGATNGTIGPQSQDGTYVTGVNTSCQGAINGTIGPQGQDGTYVTGVNTSGAVRVNNLANLETLLNLCANAAEIVGIAWGGGLLLSAIIEMLSRGCKSGMLRKCTVGAVLLIGGLAAPGVINWFVASARDANLFS